MTFPRLHHTATIAKSFRSMFERRVLLFNHSALLHVDSCCLFQLQLSPVIALASCSLTNLGDANLTEHVSLAFISLITRKLPHLIGNHVFG